MSNSSTHIADAIAKGAKHCEAKVTDSADMFLKQIGSVIRQNVAAILGCSLIVLVSGFVIFMVGKLAWDVVKLHRLHVGKTNRKQPVEPSPDHSDDVIYASSDGIDADLPDAPESSRIESKLARIKAQYSAYNRAISAYVHGRGREVDDLIDKRIVARKDDDFKYEKRKKVYRKRNVDSDSDDD
jgi:hypothetical protein